MRVFLLCGLLLLTLAGAISSPHGKHTEDVVPRKVAHKPLATALTEVSSRVTDGTGAVCSPEFRYSLSSFFTQEDSQIQFAADEADLCDMCTHVMRRAYIYRNDIRTRETWDLALREHACEDMPASRVGDCGILTSAVINTQMEYFSSTAVDFSPEELAGTTDVMSTMLDTKGYSMCLATACCPAMHRDIAVAELSQPLPVDPDLRDQLQEVTEARAELQRQKLIYDNMEEQIEAFRRESNKKEADLLIREKNVADLEAAQVAKDLELQAEVAKQEERQAALDDRESSLSEREANIAQAEANERLDNQELTQSLAEEDD